MTHLLVGLGNPGKKYDDTRHNAGFMAIDEVMEKIKSSDPNLQYREKFHGKITLITLPENQEKLILLKPQTYMNKSGLSVGGVVRFYQIPLENIMVCHDELDLPIGKFKIKKGGGSGGHNGIKDIDHAIGNNYHRFRIGIAHPGESGDVKSYVLQNFNSNDRKIIDDLCVHFANSIQYFINGDIDLFRSRMHEGWTYDVTMPR